MTDAAKEVGNQKVANMVMLGAYLQVTGAVNDESVLSALAEQPGRLGVHPRPLLRRHPRGLDQERARSAQGIDQCRELRRRPPGLQQQGRRQALLIHLMTGPLVQLEGQLGPRDRVPQMVGQSAA